MIVVWRSRNVNIDVMHDYDQQVVLLFLESMKSLGSYAVFMLLTIEFDGCYEWRLQDWWS